MGVNVLDRTLLRIAADPVDRKAAEKVLRPSPGRSRESIEQGATVSVACYFAFDVHNGKNLWTACELSAATLVDPSSRVLRFASFESNPKCDERIVRDQRIKV